MTVTREFVLYVDDSGTKDYPPDVKYFKTKRMDGCSRYFVWGGVLMLRSNAQRLSNDIALLKQEDFRTSDVEIKSNWLRIPKERKRRYLDRFGIEEYHLNRFVDKYYELICATDLQLIAIVVDKKLMMERYKHPYLAHTVAYDFLLQRVQHELGSSAICHVTVDSFGGGSREGKAYRNLLEQHHRTLLTKGSSLLDRMTFPLIAPTVRFRDSARSHLIQVADISAYNVYRQFVDHGDAWETRGLSRLPQYDHFARLLGKYRTDPNGRLQGYGVVKFPIQEKVLWHVQK